MSPTYDYECVECNEIVEIYCSIAEKDSQTCPRCGSKLKQKISPPTAIIQKGMDRKLNGDLK